MNADEQMLALALAKCTFIPGIPTKRFARDMADCANHMPDKILTPPQRKYLCEAVIKFRRQIPQSVVSLAQKMLLHPTMP